MLVTLLRKVVRGWKLACFSQHVGQQKLAGQVVIGSISAVLALRVAYLQGS